MEVQIVLDHQKSTALATFR